MSLLFVSIGVMVVSVVWNGSNKIGLMYLNNDQTCI